MNMLNRGKLALVSVAALAVLLASPMLTFAQSSTPSARGVPAFVLEPSGQDGSYIEATMDAGASQEFTITIGNAGTASAPSRTFVADAFTLTNGGFGVEQDGEATTGATTWITYPSESIELAAGERVERTLTVSVPAGTAPGQYISGLVLQTAEPIGVNGTEMLRQIIRKAIAVFITVPGPVTPELTFGDASIKQSSSSTSLLVGVTNTGNVLLKPAGTLTLTNADGTVIVSAPIAMGSVYAGTATSIEIPIPTVLAPGDYVVAVELADAETGANATVSSLPLTVTGSLTASPVASPVSIETMTVEPVLDPTGKSLQFVNVDVTLSNTEAAVSSARLTMHVTRDGVLVEDLALNSSLVVPTGTVDITQRYFPLSGWTPGSYSFAVTLEAVNATTGQTTILATGSATGTVVVP